MKAVLIKEYIKDVSEAKSKIVANAPEPTPKKDELLVDVKCIGLNFYEILQMQGKYQPFPWVAGTEFSGVVRQAPANSPIKVGTRVCGCQQGSYAERVAVDPKALIPLPDDIPFDQGAGIFMQYPTSYAALVLRAKVQPGEWVLVHAAAGGVGLAACQIAHALGARVIGVCSGDKHPILKKYGYIDHCLDYNKDTWPQEAKKLANNGKGPNVVIDPIGAIVKSLKCIAWNGRIVVVGFAAGTIEKVPANLVLLKQCSIVGLFWGAHAINEPEVMPKVYKALIKLFEEGKIKVAVYDRDYQGLDSIPQALQDMWERKTWGKAVIRMDGSSSNSSSKI